MPTLPTPHTEHVIDDVFYAIEQSPEYLEQYDRLCRSWESTSSIPGVDSG
jgi:hypothetical protein